MPDAAEASLLTFLGLEPLEDAVYRLLVDRPDSEPATLAGESTGRVEDVAHALDVLVERGLASARPAGDAVIQYRAASPCSLSARCWNPAGRPCAVSSRS